MQLTNVEEFCKITKQKTKFIKTKRETGSYKDYHNNLSRHSKAGANEIDELAADAKESIWLKQK